MSFYKSTAWKSKSTHKIVDAVYLEPTIESIIEASRFVGKKFVDDDIFEEATVKYAYCDAVFSQGLKIESSKVANMCDYIVKGDNDSLHVISKDEFKRCYEPIQDISMEVNIHAEEYRDLIETGIRVANRLNNILSRLKNPVVKSYNYGDKNKIDVTIRPTDK
mgnify:CR=1 FL=1